jgi:hypothetical protein
MNSEARFFARSSPMVVIVGLSAARWSNDEIARARDKQAEIPKRSGRCSSDWPFCRRSSVAVAKRAKITEKVRALLTPN